MRAKQRFLTAAGVAVALSFTTASHPAFAGSGPRALGVRLKCPQPAGGAAGRVADCRNVSGWFEGRLEWVSGGQVLFQEDGPFVGLAGNGLVQLYLDANHDERLFQRIYESNSSLAPSILTAPDLTTRLFVKDLEGKLVLVSEERYAPEAGAVWTLHSQDTAQVTADLGEERTARVAGDKALSADVLALSRERQVSEASLMSLLSAEVEARKQGDSAALSSMEDVLHSYTYSRAEVDAKVSSIARDARAFSDGAAPLLAGLSEAADHGSVDPAGAAAAGEALGPGLTLQQTESGQVRLSMRSDYQDGSAFDDRFVRQAAKGGKTMINSSVVIDGTLKVNGPIQIVRPDGSVKIGHGSSILELIGADPYTFPVAPSPTIYFSPDTAHQLLAATQFPVSQRNQVQIGLLNAQSSQLQVQANPNQQIPVFNANNTALTQVGVIAAQNAQLQAGPHVVSGETGEVRLSGAMNVPGNPAYTGFKAPQTPFSSLAANPVTNPEGSFLYTLPANPPSPSPPFCPISGQTWINDGSGNLTWSCLVGDVTGGIAANTVRKIQNKNVSATPPSVNGQIFDYNLATDQWQPDSNMTLPGSATIAGTLGVAGATSLSNTLTVAGATQINNTLNATGNTSLGGTLTVTGATNLNNTLDVSGATTLLSTLGVTGASTLNSTLTVQGATQLNNSLTVAGTTNLNNTLTVGGAATFNNNVTVAGTTNLTSTLGVTGATTLNNTLNVSGATVLNGTLNVAGTSNFSGGVTVAGLGTFSTISVGGDVSAGGNMNVTGSGTFGTTGYFGSSVTVGGSGSGNLTVAGSGSFGNNLSVTGNGSFTGSLTFGGSGYFGGAVTTNSNLTVNGSATTNGNQTVLGSMGVNSGSPPFPYRLTVTGDMYANGWMRISGSNPLYFQSYGGGWYMNDTTWIRAYNNKSIITSGEIRGGTVRGDNEVCIGTDCRTRWVDGFNCNTAGASNAYGTCGGARIYSDAAWTTNFTDTDYLPGRDTSEHWYRIRFLFRAKNPGSNIKPEMRPHVFLESGKAYYRFDVFTDCVNSVSGAACSSEGGTTTQPYIGLVDWEMDYTNDGQFANYADWQGYGDAGYMAAYFYIRVRPMSENRSCQGYTIRFRNDGA